MLAALLALAGCGTPPPAPQPPAFSLQTASLEQLVARFNQAANAVQTMSLKLDLTAKSGNKKYPSVSAYLLTQKPDSLRIWGSFTLLGRLFDMASDGTDFELSLPTRNQFIIGKNQVIPAHSAHPLETLRPQVILNALLINPIGPQLHVAFDPDEDATDYDVLVLAPGSGGVDRLLRRITFSRYDLLPHRQVIYDGDDIHATRATYSHYVLAGIVPVPKDMTIERPVEDYSLRLQVQSNGIVLNRPFPDPHTFVLQPPPGSTIIHLGGATPPPG